MDWGLIVRALVCPGLLCALVLGLLLRGIASWVGAHLGRRPAFPAWWPALHLLHLSRKSPRAEAGSPTPRMILPGAIGLAALCWAATLLPWPQWSLPTAEPPAAAAILYPLLLTIPAWTRLALIGFTTDPLVALGARRRIPIEVARLFPLLLAALALPLSGEGFELSAAGSASLDHTLIALAAAGILLLTLPWPLWDRDEHDAPLAPLGGRSLAIYHALTAVELSLQVYLVALALSASGLLPADREIVPLGIAAGAAIVVLSLQEAGRLKPDAAGVVHRYTRWLLPAGLLIVVAALWPAG